MKRAAAPYAKPRAAVLKQVPNCCERSRRRSADAQAAPRPRASTRRDRAISRAPSKTSAHVLSPAALTTQQLGRRAARATSRLWRSVGKFRRGHAARAACSPRARGSPREGGAGAATRSRRVLACALRRARLEVASGIVAACVCVCVIFFFNAALGDKVDVWLAAASRARRRAMACARIGPPGFLFLFLSGSLGAAGGAAAHEFVGFCMISLLMILTASVRSGGQSSTAGLAPTSTCGWRRDWRRLRIRASELLLVKKARALSTLKTARTPHPRVLQHPGDGCSPALLSRRPHAASFDSEFFLARFQTGARADLEKAALLLQ